MSIDVERLSALQARLPRGFAARHFREEDRDRLVELRNREVHPMQQGDAADWRHWERLMPDPTLLRVVVEGPDGDLSAAANVSSGGVTPHPDGAVNGGVHVAPAARGRGIGGALLAFIEDEGRRRSAPRLLSSASADQPASLAWAAKRGYREIGRRIEAYVDLASFDPATFPRARHGLRLLSVAELLAGRDEGGREEVLRELYDAQAEAWQDIPFPSPVPHWPYDRFRAMALDERTTLDLSVVALDGPRIASLTTTGRYRARDAVTVMTGTRRAYRGRGLALAVKVEALSRAKAKGLRAMLTANDEPNAAMRGINARLGYRPLPAHVALEKRLG